MILLDDRPIVGVDTEGSRVKVWSVQFSTTPGTGYTLRDQSAIDKFHQWVVESRPRPLISLHNSLWDLKILTRAGMDLVAEDIDFIDTMVLAYVLNVEPQGLKPLCYRHAGMLQDSYDDIIGDAGYSIAFEYLCKVAGAEDAPVVVVPPPPFKSPKQRKKESESDYHTRLASLTDQWTVDHPPQTIRQWPDPEPELVFEGNGVRVKKSQGVSKLVDRILSDVMSGKRLKDGDETDPRARWEKLSVAAKAPVVAVLGEMREPDLDDIPLERAVRYSARDSDAQLRITKPLWDKVKAMGLEGVSHLDHSVIPMIYRMSEVGIQLAPVKFWDGLEAQCEAQMAKAKFGIFQETGREVNPGSGDQVADLLYGPKTSGGLGLTPPMMTDGGETGKIRGSTNDKCLEALLAESPIVEMVEQYREADKVRGTYVAKLRDMAAVDDHRARVTFKITRQVTGRFTTAEPMNLLSIPVRSKLGEQCRYGFVASPGKVMFDADLGQIEMRTFAHMSRDKYLCQVIWDGKDIHTMTAAAMFSVKEADVKKFMRNAAKQVGFGIINGISPRGLVNQMILYRATREDGSRWTEDDCEQMINTWFGVYKGGRQFQLDCIKETQATGMAVDPLSGRIRYLPQIWSPQRQVREEAERCSYSHKIQTSANTILKRAMKVIWDCLRSLEGWEPLLPVHDEVLSEMWDREADRDLVQTVVEGALTTTTKLIVPIKAEGGFGASWGEAH